MAMMAITLNLQSQGLLLSIRKSLVVNGKRIKFYAHERIQKRTSIGNPKKQIKTSSMNKQKG